MKARLASVVLAMALVPWLGAPAYAQGGGTTATLSGVVTDADGGVLPGAVAVVKNNATSVSEQTVTNTRGVFLVPGLNPGTYTLTVTMTGFKQYIMNDIRLLAGAAAEVTIKLELGVITQTVEVTGGVELIQTQSPTIQSTVKAEDIKSLPVVTTNTLNLLVFLPGVETTGGPRGSTISGLPQNTINITIDGISTSNNLQSGDGFFSMVVPKLDAVEEVTVTGAVPGAQAGGQGSVQIAFVTRSGTNRYKGTAYYYLRHPNLNSNYHFNIIRGLDRNRVILNQFGASEGGPIQIPGLLDGRGKAFFFFHYEHFYQPTEVTRTRTTLMERAQGGLYSWNVTVGGVEEQRSVNLFSLAAANGFLATPDPTINALLNQIRAATGTTGVVTTDPSATNTHSYAYQSAAKRIDKAPTTRIDFNLTQNHRLSGSYWWQRIYTEPDILNSADPVFPGFPNLGIQASYRTTGNVTLRSTLGSGLVNELKTGWQWSPVDFFSNVNPGMFENQGGFAVTLGFVTSVTAANSPQPRNTTNWSIDNNLTWLRGNHSLSFGLNFTQIRHDQNSKNAVPTITLGFDQNRDPANAMFTTANFPGASNAQLNSARSLYAMLTGRITSIAGTMRLSADTGEYVYIGNLNQKSMMNELGFFVQDQWRVSPTVTLNAGVRYELPFPFTPITSTYSTATLADLCGLSGIGSGPGGRECNLFQPGNFSGAAVTPQYTLFEPNKASFEMSYTNFSPNVGVAWRPNVQDGILRMILGDPDQATVRAGYSVSFNRERMDRFTGLYGGNPGGTVSGTRNATNGNLVYAGETWPVLFREKDRLGQPNVCPDGVVSALCVPRAPAYPIVATIANSINILDPNITTPFVRSWSIGIQRSLGRNDAIEIRYVGNRNENAWTTENWNQRDFIANGFLDEFQLAMNNLQANLAAGRGNTFRYFGEGTGTSPLPIHLAYFSGVPFANAGDPARYTSTNFTNTTWLGRLTPWNPSPQGAVNALQDDATFRANAIAAGLPANFIVMNPAVNNANITKSLAGSRYHSLQIDYRRRLSSGLTVNANYVYAVRYGSSLQTLWRDRYYLRSANVPHAWKTTWVYDVPVGTGKRFGSGMNPWLNGLIGGWQWSGTGRVQLRMFEADGVRLVGMSVKDLQKAFKLRKFTDPTTGVVTYFTMPEDIILNTRRAFNTSATSETGYSALGVPEGRYIAPSASPGCLGIYPGDCGEPRQILITGAPFARFDMRIQKQFPLKGRANVELNIEFLNVFNAVNFNYNFNPGSGSGIFQATSGYTDINTTFDPGGRLGQIVWRVNW